MIYIHVVNLNLYIIDYAVLVKMLQNNSEPRENGEKGIPSTASGPATVRVVLRKKTKVIILVEIYKIIIKRIRHQSIE